jgi:hypothetical protein
VRDDGRRRGYRRQRTCAVGEPDFATQSTPNSLREIRKIDGQFAEVLPETIATSVTDPWKEFNRK